MPICSSKFSLVSIVMPKYLISSFAEIDVFRNCISKSGLGLVILGGIIRVIVFWGLTVIVLAFVQMCIFYSSLIMLFLINQDWKNELLNTYHRQIVWGLKLKRWVYR